ncbi:HET-domain-containing protein [Echria macrotheca]|uniref:HET-domain-containing protein n=1 Tax=Echria macrotheca TaxID=438768 RepID=A0AAJ0F2T5_9PEZI|nr:HET-domain-containing protein [Echria macrotheca]
MNRDEELCETCRKIDLDTATRGDYPFDYRSWDQNEVTSLWTLGPQPYSQLAASAQTCKLCRFFLAFFDDMSPPDAAEPRHPDNDPVTVFLKNNEYHNLGSPWGTAFHFITCETGYLRPYFVLTVGKWHVFPEDRIQLCRAPRAQWPPIGFRVPERRVPYGLIREWLGFCRQHHGKECSDSGQATLKSLRMVDCEADPVMVVPYSATEMGGYAALSYVWGQQTRTDGPVHVSGTDFVHLVLPPVLPRTIQDAITVARELGFRYLWVDQYCIPHDDEAEEARQIGRMDEIYRGADLTIVASAGTHADYGIPGVSVTPREAPPRLVTIGKYTLVDMPKESFSLSRAEANWFERGWTYQEGVLSRRRLMFTENQVCFQCEDMDVWEGLDIPLDILHYEPRVPLDQDTGRQFRQARTFDVLQWFQYQKTTHSVDFHIMCFLSRELTRPDDAIRAVKGIFSRFNATCRTIRVLSGLPLYVTAGKTAELLLGPPNYPMCHAALLALAWKFGWSSNVKRREPFPTWTWAGWQKRSGYSGLGYQRANHGSSMVIQGLTALPSVQVGVMAMSEAEETQADSIRPVTWQELDHLPWDASGGQLDIPFLALTGWTFKVSLLVAEESGKTELEFSVLPPWYSGFFERDVWFQYHHDHGAALARGLREIGEGSKLLAMPLYWDHQTVNTEQADMPTLILAQTSREVDGKPVYERIGLARFFFRGKNLTALLAETDSSRLPSWAREKFQTVYVG